ncbi:MAG TPA: peptidoglycan-binding protein LysM [Methylophilaceae bacterium]|nr:peptidoglycan-binding protein LysM [Methylophilaceae bacterium]HAJ72292.1 peptidoglycan-binding protein LysM [Methylophilaceae bacterium]
MLNELHDKFNATSRIFPLILTEVNCMFRHIITLLSLCCLSLSVMAEDIPLQKNYPERYTVVKGDTLWDISGKFLKNPWQWPKIWNMNRAQIKNPHWIYPGDVIVLDTSSGKPELKLLSQKTVTLEPSAVVEPLAKEGIHSIPPNIIGPFLNQPLLIENSALDSAPRIVGAQDNRLVLSPGTRVYVSNLTNEEKTFYNIYRAGSVLKDPDTQEVLGTEAIYLGDTRITKFGQPASADIVKAKEEIFTKDRLVEANEDFNENFIPHAPESDINGRIIKIYGGVAEAGPKTVVVINRGKSNGLEEGHVLAISRYGKTIKDPEYKKENQTNTDKTSTLKPGEIKLPDERIGLVMVFRTFDRVSYGLIMQASDSVNVLDAVHTP